MARRLFFVNEVRNGRAELRGEEAKHLSKVLRVEAGQLYEISDNGQKYLAKVSEAHKEAVKFEIVEKLDFVRELPEIHLYAAIIKFEHFEWGIEKATELGVDRIVPVQSARTETGLEKAVAKRLERWRRIGLEASQQSRRVLLPQIDGVSRLKDVLRVVEGERIFLDESRDGVRLGEIETAGEVVSVLAGPEGGWTDEERGMVVEAGWKPASLGPRILRAETAWLAALAILRR